ncbi:MAG: L-threonylcarbamoyladenylate synthase, partial [Oscillospiraceae bacterium]|nr:L-threonylcarbamoyladenylate synthase [Oscillospiraceae bacterium]
GTVARDIPPLAYILGKIFWDGPLTMVLKKRRNIPSITSGGLDTVAVRVPSHPIFKKIITLVGIPIAAPSANLSGKPSPTTVQHVLDDFDGIIPAAVDGGECEFGIESTVISFDSPEIVRILRPGIITKEKLLPYCKAVMIDSSVCGQPSEIQSDQTASPGMKYTHYSPKAEIILIDGSFENFARYVMEHYTPHTYALLSDKDGESFPFRHITFGDTYEKNAQNLFKCFRELDKLGAQTVYIRTPEKHGIGLALYNRLIRAAGFRQLTVL